MSDRVNERIVCRTVAELRAALATFPDDAVPVSVEPPFDGVAIVPQRSGNLLIVPPMEWHEYLKTQRQPEVA